MGTEGTIQVTFMGKKYEIVTNHLLLYTKTNSGQIKDLNATKIFYKRIQANNDLWVRCTRYKIAQTI